MPKKKKRRWLLRILVTLLLIASAAVGALYIIQKYYLTDIVRKVATPPIEQATGVDFGIGNVTAGIFSGSATIRDITLGNPEGYLEPDIVKIGSVGLSINLRDLLRGGTVHLSEIFARGAELTIENAPGKQLNIVTLHNNLNENTAPAETSPSSPEKREGDPEREPEKVALPHIFIEKGDIDLTVRYVSHAARSTSDIILTEELILNGLTIGGPAAEWASFTLTGSLKGNSDVAVTQIEGRIAPIEDPERISFEINGNIANINKNLMQRYLGKYGIEPASLSLNVVLKCNDNVYDKKASCISLIMQDVKLPEKISRKMPGKISTFPKLSVPLHIGGTLQSPKTDDFISALMKATLTNLKDNPELTGAIIESLSDKIMKELRRH